MTAPKAKPAEAAVQQNLQERWDDEVRQVMATPAGRGFVFQVLGGLGVYEHAPPVTATEAEVHRFLGRREAGLEVYERIKRLEPDLHRQMIREQQDAEADATRRIKAAREADGGRS